MSDAFVIGVDYGTDSVRSVIVDTRNGEEVGSSVHFYRRWGEGLYCNASENRFRQHPLDYIEGLELTVTESLRQAGSRVKKNVRGLSVDTTGSTPVAVDRSGTPLALLPGFEENPNAMFVLWKDHTATREAWEMNEHAAKFPLNYLKYVGGIYSSEWFWAKLLHVLRDDTAIRGAIWSWVEHCDWIPFLLTGGSDASKLRRGVCAAGHKALWAPEFGGLPPDSFFSALDPLLAGFRDRISNDTYTADQRAGQLSEAWAHRLGLSRDVVVGIGAFDCHMGAVGGQIEPYYLSKVMGTSTCDMMVMPPEEMNNRLVRGICGQVRGSILPGMIGLEAGQSAFGDTYAWFRNLLLWPVGYLSDNSSFLSDELAARLKEEAGEKIIAGLSAEAARIPLETDDELAMDWLNGRRTPDANQFLKGAMMGLGLGSDAPRLFKAWVEATCFGARAIADRIREEGIALEGLIGLGGVARKNPYIMQVMASVMNMPIRIHRSEQTCALGAAMFAATAAGIYSDVPTAMNAMGQGFDLVYHPEPSLTGVYARRYEAYRSFGAAIEKMTGSGVAQPILTH